MEVKNKERNSITVNKTQHPLRSNNFSGDNYGGLSVQDIKFEPLLVKNSKNRYFC